MQNRFISPKWHHGAVALLVVALAACSKAPEPVKPPMPSPAPSPAPAAPAPQVSIPAAAVIAPLPAVTASAGPKSPSKPAKHAEPELSSMTLARTNSKLGVPVDLRYQFDGAAAAGQPMTLHLAAVPRAEVGNLSVSIKPVAGITTDVSALRAEKATIGTAYRQQLSLTRQAEGPTELRVLVTTELPQGRAFSYFSVPLTGVATANKQAPVEMR